MTTAACGDVSGLAVVEAAAPTLFVSEKLTVISPVTTAVTAYCPPAVEFTVTVAEATPALFLRNAMLILLLLNLPDAPDPGAVNVTITPDTGLLPPSFTVTANG